MKTNEPSIESMLALVRQTPTEQIDPDLMKLIKEWKETPTALDVLYILDQAAHSALASRTAMLLMDTILMRLIDNEATSYEEVAKLATWRYKVV